MLTLDTLIRQPINEILSHRTPHTLSKHINMIAFSTRQALLSFSALDAVLITTNAFSFLQALVLATLIAYTA